MTSLTLYGALAPFLRLSLSFSLSLSVSRAPSLRVKQSVVSTRARRKRKERTRRGQNGAAEFTTTGGIITHYREIYRRPKTEEKTEERTGGKKNFYRGRTVRDSRPRLKTWIHFPLSSWESCFSSRQLATSPVRYRQVRTNTGRGADTLEYDLYYKNKVCVPLSVLFILVSTYIFDRCV